MSQLPDINNFLEEVYAHLDPEDIFERDEFDHVWNKTRDKWRGRCPWHDSKSGTAFYVDPDSLTWRCPACDRGGGPIQYLHQIRGGTGSPRGKQFLGIAKELGRLAKVEFPEKELTEEERKHIQRLENRRSMLESVISFCHRLLVTESKIAISYLTEDRGFTLSDIEDLQLGVFPGAHIITEMLVEKGFSIADAIECGLVYERRDAEGNLTPGVYGSSLSGYIIVPWNDEHGRPLTLYGRWQAKTPPEGRPKTTALRNPGSGGEPWLRSKQSPLYLDRALAAGHKDLVVVEGVFDAGILQVRGETRAIAWVAATAAEEQIHTLEKCKIESVTFCLDPDGAGESGTSNGVERLSRAGIQTYTTSVLPDGLDPDEFVLSQGMEAWHTHVETRVHGLRFKAREILAANNAQTDKGKQMAIAAGREFCKDMPESMTDAINAFFWDEFKQQTGLELQFTSPKARSEELKAAVAELERVRDPFDRALLESTIKQEFKVSGEVVRALERTFVGEEGEDDIGSFANTLDETYDDLEDRVKNPGIMGIPSGFHTLDDMTGGWGRKTFNVIAGRPSMGKTGFMVGCALHAAKNGYATRIISVESGRKDLSRRIFSSELSIDGNKFKTGALTAAELNNVRGLKEDLKRLPLDIRDTKVSLYSHIDEYCRAQKESEGGLDLVLIDYLQLISYPGNSNRNLELSAITRNLKEMARDLDIAILCLSQLSREVENRAGNRPVMSDLRDSGAIESDSDIICMLYRDEYYNQNTPEPGIAEVIITKSRDGATGMIKLGFKPQFTRFDNLKPSTRNTASRNGHRPETVMVPFDESDEKLKMFEEF